MTTTQSGGFLGDPTDAFTPPAAGGCCGSAPSPAIDNTVASSASGCCGSAEAAAAAQCCTPAAREEAVDAGAGCCG